VFVLRRKATTEGANDRREIRIHSAKARLEQRHFPGERPLKGGVLLEKGWQCRFAAIRERVKIYAKGIEMAVGSVD
jgi:hypothetical protein